MLVVVPMNPLSSFREPGGYALPYWIRVALWLVLPILALLVALLVGPRERIEDAGLPLVLGCGSVLFSLVGGGAWR